MMHLFRPGSSKRSVFKTSSLSSPSLIPKDGTSLQKRSTVQHICNQPHEVSMICNNIVKKTDITLSNEVDQAFRNVRHGVEHNFNQFGPSIAKQLGFSV
nr:expressed protein [Hymenolepis microstoma]